jgi:hypothetical protein
VQEQKLKTLKMQELSPLVQEQELITFFKRTFKVGTLLPLLSFRYLIESKLLL